MSCQELHKSQKFLWASIGFACGVAFELLMVIGQRL